MILIEKKILPTVVLGFALYFCAWIFPAPAAGEIEIKVRIGNEIRRLDIAILGGGDLIDNRNRKVKTLRANEVFVWEAPGNAKAQVAGKADARGKKERKARRPPQTKKSDPWLGKTIRFVPRRGQATVNRLSYRGNIWVTFTSAGAVIVNQLRLDDYIRGVVGREMGSLSPLESLKAQAVMARTYAVSNRGKHGKNGFDLCNAEHCQVYGGMAAERASINAAVDGTRGIIMTSDGFPTSIMYHATCGGSTEDNDLVYGTTPLPYLRGVPCRFCRDGTNFRWTRRLPVDLIRRRMAAEKQPFNVLKKIEIRPVEGKDRTGHVILVTDKGQIKVKGTVFRRIFSLPSTYFWIQRSGTVEATANAKKSVASNGNKPQHGLPYGAIEVPMKSALAGKQPIESSFGSLPIEFSAKMAGKRDGGPKQLVIQTKNGLHRVARPKDGWSISAAVSGDPEKHKLQQPKRNDSAAFSPKPDSHERITAATLSKEIALQGRGYGHQVGMCQAGAIGAGREGWNYRKILGYYFRGVALRRLP